jgi:hypothetical protein
VPRGWPAGRWRVGAVCGRLGEGGALDAALEFAETIDALARRVENAAQAEDEVTAP